MFSFLVWERKRTSAAQNKLYVCQRGGGWIVCARMSQQSNSWEKWSKSKLLVESEAQQRRNNVENVLHEAWKLIKAQWILANVHFSLFWLFEMCGNWAVCSDTSCQKYSYSLAWKSTKQWGAMQKVCSSDEDHHKDIWRAIRHVFDILMKITGVTLLLCKCVFSQTCQISYFSIDFCTVYIWLM